MSHLIQSELSKVNNHNCLMDYNSTCNLIGMTLGERLKKARLAAGFTQRQLSQESGVKQQTISRIEVGLSSETAQTVLLAKALGVRPEWLDIEDGPMYARKDKKEVSEPEIPQNILRMARFIMSLPQNKMKALLLILGEDFKNEQEYPAPNIVHKKNIPPSTSFTIESLKNPIKRATKHGKRKAGGEQ